MRLLRLRLKNLNSFKKGIELDFLESPLKEASLFAITGPTGSGKTTLLDAICVAIFGKTPRLDGKGNQNPQNLLTQGKDEGFAEVIFEANGNRYLSEWRVKRNSKGDTTSDMKLADFDTGDLITNKKRDIENEIEGILGLKYDAFLRSIMLAQGNFEAFLKAKADEKRQILEKVTGMEIYEEMKEALNNKVKEVEKAFIDERSILDKIPQASSEEIKELDKVLEELELALKESSKRQGEIEKERKYALRRQENFENMVALDSQLKKLDSEKEYYRKLTDELRVAEAAGNIRTEMEQYLSYQKELQEREDIFAKAKKDAADALEKKKASEADFTRAVSTYEEFLKIRDERLSEIDEAFKEEIQANERQEQAALLKKDAEEIQKEINHLTSAIEGYNKSIIEMEDKKAKCEDIIAKSILPAEPRKVLAKLQSGYSILSEKIKTYNERIESKVSIEKKLISEEETLETFLKDKETECLEISKITKRAEDLKAETEGILNGETLSYWKERHEALHSATSLCSEYQIKVLDLANKEEEVTRLDEAIKLKSKERNGLSDDFHELTITLNSMEGERENLKAELKELELTDLAGILRRDFLQEDKPCPVCGSKEHPMSEVAVTCDEDLRKVTLELREKLGLLDERIQTYREENAKREQRISDLKSEISKMHEDKIKIVQSRDELKEALSVISEKWGAIFLKSPIDQKVITQEITKVKGIIDGYNGLLQEVKDEEGNIRVLEERVKRYEDSIEKASAQIKDFKNQVATLSEAILTSEGEVKSLQEEMLDAIPADLRDLKMEEALYKFERAIEEVEKAGKQLSVYERDLENLKNKLEVDKNLLSVKNEEYNKKMKTSEALAEEGQNLLLKACQKTGGLKAIDAKGRLEERARTLSRIKEEEGKAFENLSNLSTHAQAILQGADSNLIKAKEWFKKSQELYIAGLKKQGFSTIEEHRNALKPHEWREDARREIQNFQDNYNTLMKQIEELKKTFEEEEYDPNKLPAIEGALRELTESIAEFLKRRGAVEKDKQNKLEVLAMRRKQEEAVKVAQNEFERWSRLQETIPANTLRDFALRMTFDTLIRFANKQLFDLTHRYRLKVSDMRDMVVLDLWNAGEERPVETLSGGESFLTSLSLALALTEMSQGSASLRSLFLDEGFGTLDAETLDTALSALEGLRSRGRTIGLISHVQELTRRVPVQIRVKRLGNGSSDIEVRG